MALIHDKKCSGFNAGWCDIHGTCVCPDQANRGVRVEHRCPLHRLHTKHDGGWSPELAEYPGGYR